MNLDPTELAARHRAGLDFESYLDTDPERAAAWREIHRRVELDVAQSDLLDSFSRRMPVLVVSGIWCGDCAQQGPLLERIAEASGCIDLRWIDRDEHPEFSSKLRINGGDRVPVVVFMSEDHEPVSIFGDRTLSRYRAMAVERLGPSCPIPNAPVPQDALHATLQDWLDEFERVQLLLRLSPRLRDRHGD